jgi:hypothetical protein
MTNDFAPRYNSPDQIQGSMAAHIAGTKILYSEEEKSEIQQQLGHLLANIHFSNSKRFRPFSVTSSGGSSMPGGT